MLSELAHELEAARDVAGHWFGRYSMAPLSVTDDDVEDLRRSELVDVLDWVEEHASTDLGCLRVVARPLYVRVSTQGWSLIL